MQLSGQEVCLSRGDDGLGHMARVSVADLEYAGQSLLCRGAGGGLNSARPSGDFPYGSGRVVYIKHLHHRPQRSRGRHQHGWQRVLGRRSVCGTVMVQCEVRGSLSQILSIPMGSSKTARAVLPILQQ